MTPETRAFLLRAAPPLLVAGVIALFPVPEGLKPQAWYYFALFAAVIVGVATEPIPPGAIGLAGVVIAAMSGLVFKNPTQAVNWALSGFGQPTVFFFVHYLFATISGHATALLPLFLVVAVNVPGLSAKGWALALAYTFGMMGILTPYATGPSRIYGCGYISPAEFWILGFVVGAMFLGTYLLIGVPWLVWRSF